MLHNFVNKIARNLIFGFLESPRFGALKNRSKSNFAEGRWTRGPPATSVHPPIQCQNELALKGSSKTRSLLFGIDLIARKRAPCDVMKSTLRHQLKPGITPKVKSLRISTTPFWNPLASELPIMQKP